MRVDLFLVSVFFNFSACPACLHVCLTKLTIVSFLLSYRIVSYRIYCIHRMLHKDIHWHCFACMIFVFNVFYSYSFRRIYLCLSSTTAYCQCCFKETTWHLILVSVTGPNRQRLLQLFVRTLRYVRQSLAYCRCLGWKWTSTHRHHYNRHRCDVSQTPQQTTPRKTSLR